MRKLVRASLLILAVSCTAYAGEMPFPVAPPQPAPTSTQESTQEIRVNDSQDQNGSESTVAEAILDLISTVLALV